MKAVIIDQNLNEAQKLENLCKVHLPFISEVASFSKVESLRKSLEVDLIYLKVDHGMNSQLHTINQSKNKNCAIILIIDDEEYAMTAFKHQVDGCLMQPIEVEELIKVSTSIKNRYRIEQDAEELKHFQKLINDGPLNKIALSTLEGYTFVAFDDIVRCEAQGNYTNVYFFDGSFLMLTKTLKHYDQILENKGFIRLHKTHLVNKKYIRSFTKG